MAQITLGIDFGSSFCTIVKKEEGIVLKEPNMIAVKKDGNSFLCVAVGSEAKNMIGKTDSRIAIFSPVNNGLIVSETYAAMALKQFLNKIDVKKNIFTSLKIIISIPVGISEQEKEKYYTLCSSVGAKEIIMLPKIFASALGENINISSNNAKMVVDIGGGTVESAVLNLNTIIAGSSLCVGGRTMDLTIIDYIKNKYNTVIGESTASELKEQIGSLYPNDNAERVVCGVDAENNTPSKVKITARDIYDATHLFYDEVARVIDLTIKSLSPEISADVVRNGIFVMGGYSRTVGLKQYLRQMLDVDIKISYDVEDSQAKGLNKLLSRSDVLENIISNL